MRIDPPGSFTIDPPGGKIDPQPWAREIDPPIMFRNDGDPLI